MSFKLWICTDLRRPHPLSLLHTHRYHRCPSASDVLKITRPFLLIFYQRENKTIHHLWMVKIILENIENKRSNIQDQNVRGLKERLGGKYPRTREKHGFVSKKRPSSLRVQRSVEIKVDSAGENMCRHG